MPPSFFFFFFFHHQLPFLFFLAHHILVHHFTVEPLTLSLACFHSSRNPTSGQHLSHYQHPKKIFLQWCHSTSSSVLNHFPKRHQKTALSFHLFLPTCCEESICGKELCFWDEQDLAQLYSDGIKIDVCVIGNEAGGTCVQVDNRKP